jgi:decaprenylphospho-beta-D-ribofuranose 2-oxidase
MARGNYEGIALRQSRFITFDGGFESLNMLQRPDRYRHLEADFGKAKRIARGAGLSYAAASFGGVSIVQQMSAFNRLLDFDPHRMTVHVEAGVAIGLLALWGAERGLSVPVLPGYPAITVGGCIAADVHGKNPLRDGTFRSWVEAVTLYHPAHGCRTLDRKTHPEEFQATCGGYGLTGLIVDATLRLVEQTGASVAVRRVAVRSIAEAIEGIGCSTADHDFAYSWHDGTLRGHRFGRGILFL